MKEEEGWGREGEEGEGSRRRGEGGKGGREKEWGGRKEGVGKGGRDSQAVTTAFAPPTHSGDDRFHVAVTTAFTVTTVAVICSICVLKFLHVLPTARLF